MAIVNDPENASGLGPFYGWLELMTLVRMRLMQDGVTIESFSFEDVKSYRPEA